MLPEERRVRAIRALEAVFPAASRALLARWAEGEEPGSVALLVLASEAPEARVVSRAEVSRCAEELGASSVVRDLASDPPPGACWAVVVVEREATSALLLDVASG